VKRVPGFPQSSDHVFVLPSEAVSYNCRCRFVDLFEGELYLAWSEDCPDHQPKPPGYLDDLKGPPPDLDPLVRQVREGPGREHALHLRRRRRQLLARGAVRGGRRSRHQQQLLRHVLGECTR